jgi:hypothetical protein
MEPVGGNGLARRRGDAEGMARVGAAFGPIRGEVCETAQPTYSYCVSAVLGFHTPSVCTIDCCMAGLHFRVAPVLTEPFLSFDPSSNFLGIPGPRAHSGACRSTSIVG